MPVPFILLIIYCKLVVKIPFTVHSGYIFSAKVSHRLKKVEKLFINPFPQCLMLLQRQLQSLMRPRQIKFSHKSDTLKSIEIQKWLYL